jgi:hypothetical protein
MRPIRVDMLEQGCWGVPSSHLFRFDRERKPLPAGRQKNESYKIYTCDRGFGNIDGEEINGFQLVCKTNREIPFSFLAHLKTRRIASGLDL